MGRQGDESHLSKPYVYAVYGRTFLVLPYDFLVCDFRQMDTAAFREFAVQRKLKEFNVDLKVGDMYFFKADSIHEVPAFGGVQARMNLATFIGFDEDGDHISVWS